MTYVYVINKDGKPLMPTKRCGKVRWLLKTKKAKVVSKRPFTVQLLYDTTNYTQDIILGVDAGRTNIGVNAVLENGKSVFSANITTRNKEIKKKMSSRKTARQAHRKHRREKKQRRAIKSNPNLKDRVIERVLPCCKEKVINKVIKGKEARFRNRKREKGWLTPTATQLVRTHRNTVYMVSKFLPISKVVIEHNSFDFQKLDNPNIKKWQYGKGRLHGYESCKDYIYHIQDGKCVICNKPIEHYHHIVPKSKNGRDTVDNLVGLCKHCHILVHTNEAYKEKVSEYKTGEEKKYFALSTLNQAIPYIIEEIEKDFDTYLTNGYSTKLYRESKGIIKDHKTDAYCIACSILKNQTYIEPETNVYEIKQFRRHDRAITKRENINRKYYNTKGDLVATNRKRAYEQKDTSLEDYVSLGGKVENLTVKKHLKVNQNPIRVMPGAIIEYKEGYKTKCFVLFASDGKCKSKAGDRPVYYKDKNGTKYKVSKCRVIRRNTGLVFL